MLPVFWTVRFRWTRCPESTESGAAVCVGPSGPSSSLRSTVNDSCGITVTVTVSVKFMLGSVEEVT